MKTRALTIKSQDMGVKKVGKILSKYQVLGRWLIAAICLLLFIISQIGCRAKTSAAEPAPLAVKIKTVEMNTVNKGLRYSANIEPMKQIELAFKVGGYVDHILQARGVDGKMRDLQAGDLVKAGTVLARIRQSEYAVKVTQAQSQASETRLSLESTRAQHHEAQSSVASGKAQLDEVVAAYEKARLDFERAKNLFARQSLTKPDYDAAKSQFKAAEAKREAAKAQVAMLDAKARAAASQIDVVRARISSSQAMVTEASIPLQDTSLRAPMDGIVLQRAVETGTLVSAGKAAFVIANLSSVKAIFGVPDLTVGKIKLGGTLIVTTESLPGSEFQGLITSISPSADPKSRVFEIEVTIPNTNQALKSGMIASLEVTAAPATEPVLAVPISAVVRARNQSDQYAVFVIEEKSGRQIARSRIVKLGEALGNTMAVLEGVRAGDRVITSGATLVLDGQPVQIIP